MALLEEITFLQKEAAELLQEIARTQYKGTAGPRSKADGPTGRVALIYNGLPAQPGPGQRWPASQRQPGWQGTPLTKTEQTVLRLLRTKLSLREIGQELYVSRDTVKSHTRAIYRKLGVSNRYEAVQRGRELELWKVQQA